MNYTLTRLQFGTEKRVPGLQDLDLANPTAPIDAYVADKNQQVWAHVFSYQAGQFHHAGAQVSGVDGALLKAWYSQVGGPSAGPNTFRVLPFADGSFLEAANVVDFNAPTIAANTVNTDAIEGASVTATAHYDLPEFKQIQISSQATNSSVIITTEITNLVFEQYFVIYGGNPAMGNMLTVNKGQSCLALAVYRKETTRSSREFGTLQWPKIPKSEWPQIFEQIFAAITVRGNGEIWEHLSPRLLAQVEPAVLRRAVEEIGARMAELDRIKAVVAGLAGKR